MKKLIKPILFFIVLFAAVNVLIVVLYKDKKDNSHNIELNRVKQMINEYEKEKGVAAEDLSALVLFSKESSGETEEFEYVLKLSTSDKDDITGIINDKNVDSDISEWYYLTDKKLYRVDYERAKDSSLMKDRNRTFIIINGILFLAMIICISMTIYYQRKIIAPFTKLASLPEEIAKGNLTKDIPESEEKYFGKFTWGMNMLREQLEDTKTKNLQLERDKKVLLMSLSHDIKTPLSTISLYSKAISKGLYKGDKVKTSADSIQEKVFEIEDYMKRIVNASNEDIIEFSVDNREAYIKDIVDSIDNYYRDKMKLRSVDFTIGSYNNKLIKVDPDRLVEVIQNIIENALKYGDGRRISMDINEEDGKRIVFSIKNTGCTLEKRELANIFESFYRGTNTGKQEGSGLGLYICRRLMHLMDGEIYADIISEDGEDIMNVMLELNM